MEPDELVAGRYRLVSPVGRGAMGMVWLARDELLDRQVAIKQLLGESPDDATTDEATERAMREGRIAARLRHPNAITVYDVVAHAGRPCLIMEYLRSESLGAVAATRDGLPPEEVAGIGAQVAAALAAAHTAGIVHRDVKPDNVLITPDGTAKITDFGVSHAAGVGTVTATGMLAGTPAFLAPEVAGGREADAQSDVYSLGAALYAAIEGEPPFGVDDNPIALLHRVAGGEIIPPRRAGPLTDLLLWLLRRDPAERPDMRTAHAALAAAASGERVPVPPPSGRPPTLLLPMSPRRWLSRRAVIIGIAAAGLVSTGVVIGSLTSDPKSAGAPVSVSPPTGDPPCVARYEIANSWPDGYEARVAVRNEGDRDLTGWTVRWTLPDGHEIANLWSGTLTRDGSTVTVTNVDYNVTVPAGGSITFGFVVSGATHDHPVLPVTCAAR